MHTHTHIHTHTHTHTHTYTHTHIHMQDGEFRTCVAYRLHSCKRIHNFLTCRLSKHGHCCVWPWLIEFSGVAMSCFTLSRFTIFPDVLFVKPEDSLNPLFKAILYSVSWIRKLVNSKGERQRCLSPPSGGATLSQQRHRRKVPSNFQKSSVAIILSIYNDVWTIPSFLQHCDYESAWTVLTFTSQHEQFWLSPVITTAYNNMSQYERFWFSPVSMNSSDFR